MKKIKLIGIALFLCLGLLLAGCSSNTETQTTAAEIETEFSTLGYESMPEAVEAYQPDEIESPDNTTDLFYSFDWNSIPDYSGEDIIVINGDEPLFPTNDVVFHKTYILLSELDELGRCQSASACLGQETEPTEKRGDISHVHPSGWKQMQLSNGNALYNRSHLIMFALSGLNDDDRNLITGTEYFNQKSMLSIESMVKQTVDRWNAHVLYRVTPVYDGDNLVAKGVLMEGYCIEYPEECTFCRFVYNIEPNVTIDYATGRATEETWNNQKKFSEENDENRTLFETENVIGQTYVLNTNSKKFHLPTCGSVNDMSEKNKKEFVGSRDELIAEGYSPCGSCKP